MTGRKGRVVRKQQQQQQRGNKSSNNGSNKSSSGSKKAAVVYELRAKPDSAEMDSLNGASCVWVCLCRVVGRCLLCSLLLPHSLTHSVTPMSLNSV